MTCGGNHAIRPRGLEHDIQAAVIEMRDRFSGRYPDLALLHAIPNGGDRHPAVAARLREEGVLAGVPDLCLPVPRGGWHGFYLEMKRPGERPSPEQLRIMERLGANGYQVGCYDTWTGAWGAICRYLGLPEELWRAIDG